uniref:Microtubule associated protein 9 n=1 Tax=Gopherus evgoodei TaxID=1825980 RepID=A0A8C4WB67_9SAUR
MSDEEIGTTLAYTKSPKVSRRTTFQNELQEAISARAARQQTAEYSDDFDSDEDVAFNITLSDDETTQKKALLKSEIADDLTSLLHEEKLQQMTILKSQNLSGDREDETECLFIEKLTCRDNEGDHCNESHMAILQNEREEITQHEFENKPVPKLREQRIKNISSAENVSISALDDHYKPSPQPRSVLRKSSHVEDKDVARAEDKASSSYRLSSFSAPSSLTRLSDIITTSEKRTLAESPSPEVRELLYLLYLCIVICFFLLRIFLYAVNRDLKMTALILFSQNWWMMVWKEGQRGQDPSSIRSKNALGSTPSYHVSMQNLSTEEG